jgi:hypothetical protein
MKKIALILIGLGFSACAVLKTPVAVDIKPMDVNSFMAKPFVHGEAIGQFKDNMPERTKVQKLIKRSPREHQVPDTIYNYTYKDSKISIYKTRFNQEFMLGGIVRNSEVELANGIRAGMLRDDFYRAFTDLSRTQQDTVVLEHKQIDRTFNFYFDKKGHLEKYTFTGSKK